MESDRYCHFWEDKKIDFLSFFRSEESLVIKEKWPSNILDYQIKLNLGIKESEKHIIHFLEGGDKINIDCIVVLVKKMIFCLQLQN